MTIEEAIKKAIKGGWQGFEWQDVVEVRSDSAGAWGYDKDGSGHYRPISDILIDPKFWQALGRACNWTSRKHHLWPSLEVLPRHGEEIMRREQIVEDWFYYWHLFINSLAEGKQPPEYFKNL